MITGGGGFLGFTLAQHVVADGARVTLLDVHPPAQPLPDGITFLQGDITDAESVAVAAQGADVVYHVASYGMSANEQLRDPAKIHRINVQGTRNVLAACIKHGVRRLVYVSTVNVVFVGRPIINGDESSLPYPTTLQYYDRYSSTKAQAEQAVLAADGTGVSDVRAYG